jgi:hypothetical protein
MNAWCDLVSEQSHSDQTILVERSQKDSTRIDHRLPLTHQLRDAVLVPLRKEVGDRVNDFFGYQFCASHLVMDMDLLRSIDFAEPAEVVSAQLSN